MSLGVIAQPPCHRQTLTHTLRPLRDASEVEKPLAEFEGLARLAPPGAPMLGGMVEHVEALAKCREITWFIAAA